MFSELHLEFSICSTQIQLELRCASHTHILCSRCHSSTVYTNTKSLVSFLIEDHRVVEIKKKTKKEITHFDAIYTHFSKFTSS